MNTVNNKKADLKLHLHRRAFHHVNKTKPGMTIVCEKGLVWLTESSDLQDYMLQPGATMVVDKHANMLIEALSDDADISIIYPN